MRLRQGALDILLVPPGAVCFFICLHYALRDWASLKKVYAAFERVASTSRDMPVLFVAEAKQNINRINLFADGVWALLGGVVAAIGLHGICAQRKNQ